MNSGKNKIFSANQLSSGKIHFTKIVLSGPRVIIAVPTFEINRPGAIGINFIDH